jgi:hypothetical protein
MTEEIVEGKIYGNNVFTVLGPQRGEKPDRVQLRCLDPLGEEIVISLHPVEAKELAYALLSGSSQGAFVKVRFGMRERLL